MDIMVFKLVAILAIFAVALIGGLAPLLVKESPGTARFFSLGNCLAGGVFLATGLIHMLPDGLAALEEGGVAPERSHFAIALLAVIGFAGALFAERVAGEYLAPRSAASRRRWGPAA